MSNLLNEAIVDAKALREAALKNAETVVIEKYSEEVRDTLNKLLEQEDELGLDLGDDAGLEAGTDDLGAADLGAADAGADPLAETEEEEGNGITEDEIPLGATDDLAGFDGDNLGSFSGEGEGVELNINLGALQEAVEALAGELSEDEEYEINEEQLEEILSEDEDLDEALSPAIAAAMKAKGMSTDGAPTAEPALDPQKLVNFYKNKLAKLEQELKALAGSDPAKAKAKMKMMFSVKQQLMKAQKQAGMSEEEIHEAAKPDFLDLDKDGDKKEPMSAAAKDAKNGDDGDKDEKEDDDGDDKGLSKVPPQLRKHVAKKKANEDLDHDDLISAIMEKLTVDMGADLAGWAGRRQEDKVYQIEKEMARRVSTDVAEELENLKKAHEELVFENNQLAEQNNKYNEALQELKENLQDVNLSNARLLYTNRVLRNPSLNERQKDKIAEAISGAGSVTEAKTIFDTLQSTVESAPKKSPKSLSEAIGRRSSVLRATRKEQPSSDPVSDRMKILAGIK